MLILSRRINERVSISGGITVTVLETQRGRVRLGIEAPANVAVMRTELRNPPLAAEAVGEQWDDDDETEIGGEGLQ